MYAKRRATDNLFHYAERSDCTRALFELPRESKGLADLLRTLPSFRFNVLSVNSSAALSAIFGLL